MIRNCLAVVGAGLLLLILAPMLKQRNPNLAIVLDRLPPLTLSSPNTTQASTEQDKPKAEANPDKQLITPPSPSPKPKRWALDFQIKAPGSNYQYKFEKE